ncbi:MAG: hypothetical protein QF483_05120 [Gammaproteobacteria bacterium]|jgi:hypothetical protein|nr:hypothetical protein [Gammaproteobacteria bacterium]
MPVLTAFLYLFQDSRQLAWQTGHVAQQCRCRSRVFRIEVLPTGMLHASRVTKFGEKFLLNSR